MESIEVQVARIGQKVDDIRDNVEKIYKRLDAFEDRLATKEELERATEGVIREDRFRTVERLAYGAVSFILFGVLGLVLSRTIPGFV